MNSHGSAYWFSVYSLHWGGRTTTSDSHNQSRMLSLKQQASTIVHCSTISISHAMFHSYSVPAIPSRMPIIALPKRMYTYTFDVSRLPSLRGSAASSLPTVSASAVASSAATSNWGMLGGLWRQSCWSSPLCVWDGMGAGWSAARKKMSCGYM
jgi:hypothetical protein